MSDNKKDISDLYNSVFEENVPTPTEQSNNRDYLGSLYDGGIELLDSDIRMTRSDYIRKHTEIVTEYEKENKETLKTLVWAVISFVLPFLGFLTLKELAPYAGNRYMLAIIYGGMAIFMLLMIIVPAVIILSVIKKIRLLRKGENHALEHLEQRKQDFMLMGQYDSGK